MTFSCLGASRTAPSSNCGKETFRCSAASPTCPITTSPKRSSNPNPTSLFCGSARKHPSESFTSRFPVTNVPLSHKRFETSRLICPCASFKIKHNNSPFLCFYYRNTLVVIWHVLLCVCVCVCNDVKYSHISIRGLSWLGPSFSVNNHGNLKLRSRRRQFECKWTAIVLSLIISRRSICSLFFFLIY